MKKFEDLSAELNRTRIETLLADIDLAFTFVDRAETSDVEEIRERNRAKAREALSTIREKFLLHVHLNDSQRAEIDAKLQKLQHRLEKVGENFT